MLGGQFEYDNILMVVPSIQLASVMFWPLQQYSMHLYVKLSMSIQNVCSLDIKYDAEKDEKAKQEAKQKKLQQIEEAKKLQAEKGKLQINKNILKY